MKAHRQVELYTYTGTGIGSKKIKVPTDNDPVGDDGLPEITVAKAFGRDVELETITFESEVSNFKMTLPAIKWPAADKWDISFESEEQMTKFIDGMKEDGILVCGINEEADQNNIDHDDKPLIWTVMMPRVKLLKRRQLTTAEILKAKLVSIA